MSVEHAIASDRRDRRRASRIEGILDTATTLVARDGLEALTLGRLAGELDLVPAAMYRYFASKDALVAALQRRALDEVSRRFDEAEAAWQARLAGRPADVSALGALLTAGHYYLDLPQTCPDTWYLTALLLADPRALLPDDEAARAVPLIAALMGRLNRLLEAGVAAQALRPGPAPERALALWSALQGALLLDKLRRRAPFMPTPVQVGRHALETLLLGWGAQPAALAAAHGALAASPTP